MSISLTPGGSVIPVSLTDLIAAISGRITLIGGPVPIRGQRILFSGEWSGEEQVLLFVGPASAAGSQWPCIVAWRGQANQPWTELIQGSPFQDKRTQAQQDADEVARLAAIAKSPFGGSYSLTLSPFGYPSSATYIEPYVPSA